jgi:hypothetical protein
MLQLLVDLRRVPARVTLLRYRHCARAPRVQTHNVEKFGDDTDKHVHDNEKNHRDVEGKEHPCDLGARLRRVARAYDIHVPIEVNR